MNGNHTKEAVKFWINKIKWFETLPREKQLELTEVYIKSIMPPIEFAKKYFELNEFVPKGHAWTDNELQTRILAEQKSIQQTSL